MHRLAKQYLPTALLLLCLAGLSSHPASAYNKGDLNKDGRVGIADAVLALQLAVKLIPQTTDLVELGDVSPAPDGDGKVGVDDALRILRFAVGLIAPTEFYPTAATHGLTKLFFLHHSTGDGIITEGRVREQIDRWNAAHGTSFTFWDHGYNADGLRNAKGELTGTNYDIPDDNTDPEGLYYLWVSREARWTRCRDLILANHEVIAFKSCFPASYIGDAEMLQQYKTWYLGMRSFFDTRPDRLFIVMSPPPLHRLETDPTAAANARAFANWLKSQTYLAGHLNVRCFDLFDHLAQADDGSPTANTLRYEYEISHTESDSHPNELANRTVGAVFAEFLCSAAMSY